MELPRWLLDFHAHWVNICHSVLLTSLQAMKYKSLSQGQCVPGRECPQRTTFLCSSMGGFVALPGPGVGSSDHGSETSCQAGLGTSPLLPPVVFLARCSDLWLSQGRGAACCSFTNKHPWVSALEVHQNLWEV